MGTEHVPEVYVMPATANELSPTEDADLHTLQPRAGVHKRYKNKSRSERKLSRNEDMGIKAGKSDSYLQCYSLAFGTLIFTLDFILGIVIVLD